MPDSPLRVTDHAMQQSQRRAIDIDLALEIVRTPDQMVPIREFRQSRVDDGRALIRVLVDRTDDEIVVVTMYRTTKVDKYWQP